MCIFIALGHHIASPSHFVLLDMNTLITFDEEVKRLIMQFSLTSRYFMFLTSTPPYTTAVLHIQNWNVVVKLNKCHIFFRTGRRCTCNGCIIQLQWIACFQFIASSNFGRKNLYKKTLVTVSTKRERNLSIWFYGEAFLRYAVTPGNYTLI
jgi:hypothetical protein